jgi:rhodanese-related sulfurtransferase
MTIPPPYRLANARGLGLVAVFFALGACGYGNFTEMADDMAIGAAPVVHGNEIPAGAVFLDARSKEEYSVSHIPGARYAGYDDFDLSVCNGVNRDSQVVVYCAVGYRSARIAEKLQHLGFTSVMNLWGGIFHWANEGRPLEGPSGTTARIHPYSSKWEKWIYRGIPAYE